MQLPIVPPFPPMESRQVEAIPPEGEWQYEPKWDGFRCLAFRDGGELQLQSKAGRPLARYFPDVAATLERLGARRFVLDGELTIPEQGRVSFEHLQLRLHPAASRVRKLAAERPALLVVFDLLVDERRQRVLDRPLRERRARLERFAARYIAGRDGLALSPASLRRADAEAWFARLGEGLDGIMAKRLASPYRSGERDAMVKIKHLRSADCVVGGFRYGEGSRGGGAGGTREGSREVGSLLLGLYDEAGLLHHVGFTSGLADRERPELTARLERLRDRASGRRGAAPAERGFSGGAPGGPSRWSRGREEWEALPPELVVEVQYDHTSGGRFRHGTRLLRWRPDKAPRQCTLDQIARRGPGPLDLL